MMSYARSNTAHEEYNLSSSRARASCTWNAGVWRAANSCLVHSGYEVGPAGGALARRRGAANTDDEI